MNLAEDDPEMIVARALRALRQEDGLPDRQGEEDMEDAMGILAFLRKHGFAVQPISSSALTEAGARAVAPPATGTAETGGAQDG